MRVDYPNDVTLLAARITRRRNKTHMAVAFTNCSSESFRRGVWGESYRKSRVIPRLGNPAGDVFVLNNHRPIRIRLTTMLAHTSSITTKVLFFVIIFLGDGRE
jgi:hypothetical protein